MQSVLITGCNRGIGHSLVKQLLSDSNAPRHIIATCRNLKKSSELMSLAKTSDRLKVIEVDLTHFNAYEKLYTDVKNITGDDGLNVLINNAGVSTKFTRIQLLKLDQLMENFITNTAAPLLLTKSMLPLLQKAALRCKANPFGVQKAAIVNISSILGSIASNTEGGFYPYRCSKAALNAATKSLSQDLKKDGILVVAVHPGWCNTDMGGKNAPLKVDEVTPILIETLRGLSATQSGTFLQYDGKSIPW